MKKFIWIVALTLVSFLGFKGFRWLGDNKLGNLNGPVELYVYPSSTVPDVLSDLSASVKRPASLRRMFDARRVADYLKPGHYSFDNSASSVFIARALNNGWQTPVHLTLSGSLRLKGEIARKISSQIMLDSTAVASALEDRALLGKFGFTPATAFALFMPDTYEILWTASMEDILERQKKAYDAFWTKDNMAKAAAIGLSRMQVSILASIVKGESNRQSDFSKLAGVYVNRLNYGMRLQSCPTVAFVFGYKKTRILNSGEAQKYR